jgi:hypothetical protein
MNNVVIVTLAIVLGFGAWVSTADSSQQEASTGTADSGQREAGPIRITRVGYDPWVEIKNVGQQTRQLRGWTLRDISGHVFDFPQFRLRPGTTVTVHTDHGRRTQHDLYWGMDDYAWNDSGDRATLRNRGGRLVDRCRWGNGDGLKIC